MTVQCPHCGSRFNAPDEYVGRKVKCPKCSEPFALAESEPQDEARDGHSEPAIPPDLPPEVNAGKPQSCDSSRIPQRFRDFMHDDELILYASNPSKGALALNAAVPGFFAVLSLLGALMEPSAWLSVVFWGGLTLYVWLAWKNKFYLITDKRTFAAEGIFNIAISIIPNKSIQMLCVNTGVIDRTLGLNTLEISSAAQGGTNIFLAFLGKSKGSIKFRSIAKVHEVLALYHSVFA